MLKQAEIGADERGYSDDDTGRGWDTRSRILGICGSRSAASCAGQREHPYRHDTSTGIDQRINT